VQANSAREMTVAAERLPGIRRSMKAEMTTQFVVGASRDAKKAAVLPGARQASTHARTSSGCLLQYGIASTAWAV